MIKLFKGNRYEQLGVRESERLSLDWQTICTAVSAVWKGDWNERARHRGNSALPAAWYLARNYAGIRFAEFDEISGGVTYPAAAMFNSAFDRSLMGLWSR